MCKMCQGGNWSGESYCGVLLGGSGLKNLIVVCYWGVDRIWCTQSLDAVHWQWGTTSRSGERPVAGHGGYRLIHWMFRHRDVCFDRQNLPWSTNLCSHRFEVSWQEPEAEKEQTKLIAHDAHVAHVICEVFMWCVCTCIVHTWMCFYLSVRIFLCVC